MKSCRIIIAGGGIGGIAAALASASQSRQMGRVYCANLDCGPRCSPPAKPLVEPIAAIIDRPGPEVAKETLPEQHWPAYTSAPPDNRRR